MAAPGKNVTLLEEESVLASLNPHPLSFYKLFLIWLYVLAVSALFYVYADDVAAYFAAPTDKVKEMMAPLEATPSSALLPDMGIMEQVTETRNDILSFFGLLQTKYVPLGVWILCLFIPSLAVSVLRISFRWAFIMTGVGVISTLITVLAGANPRLAYVLGITFSLAGIVGVEFYRRAHTFHVTNFRLITELDFMGYKKNVLRYDDIENLILDQSVVGRIFNFGTLIPITASGLGMGSDMSAVTLAGGTQVGEKGAMGGAVTGGRSVDVPRSRSSYILFGIPNPKKAYAAITKLIHEADEAPYLRKMTTGIEELVAQNKDLMSRLTGESTPDAGQKAEATYRTPEGEEVTTTYIVDEGESEDALVEENRRLRAELEKSRKKK